MNLNDVVNCNKLHKNKRGDYFRTIRVERVEGTDSWVKEFKEFRSAWKCLIQYTESREMKWVYFNRYNHAYAVKDYTQDEYRSSFECK